MSDIVMIAVSRELLSEMGKWGPPVQICIVRDGDGYEMIARRHDCSVDNPVDSFLFGADAHGGAHSGCGSHPVGDCDWPHTACTGHPVDSSGASVASPKA